jgi:hypothetical protein
MWLSEKIYAMAVVLPENNPSYSLEHKAVQEEKYINLCGE